MSVYSVQTVLRKIGFKSNVSRVIMKCQSAEHSREQIRLSKSEDVSLFPCELPRKTVTSTLHAEVLPLPHRILHFLWLHHCVKLFILIIISAVISIFRVSIDDNQNQHGTWVIKMVAKTFFATYYCKLRDLRQWNRLQSIPPRRALIHAALHPTIIS